MIVYHGPRADIIPFFSSLGFELPERKGAADFLQRSPPVKIRRCPPQSLLLCLVGLRTDLHGCYTRSGCCG